MQRSAARQGFSRASLWFAAPAAALLATSHWAGAQSSDLSVGPFISYLPSAGASPLAGLALTLANGPLAFRASGNLSLADRTSFDASVGNVRPWGADADVLLMLKSGGGLYRRTLAPFVFVGVGTAATDSIGVRVQQNGWSYGAGLLVPLGSALELFGEARYRMSRFVLPSAEFAPAAQKELRFGLSFHLGGGSRGSRSYDRVGGSTASSGSTERTTATAARVVGTADRYVGVKYVYGGTSPSGGFDCSGFVQYVFARNGVQLPRTARQQAMVGTPLPADWNALSAGDLVMFEEGGRIGHVAIYAGDHRIIHSTASGGGVRYDALSTQRGQWFVDHLVAARRVTPDARGRMLDLAKGFASGIVLDLDGPDHAPIVR